METFLTFVIQPFNFMKDNLYQDAEPPKDQIIVNGIEWYTYKQLALLLQVTPQTIFNRVKSGEVIREEFWGINLYRPKQIKDDRE